MRRALRFLKWLAPLALAIVGFAVVRAFQAPSGARLTMISPAIIDFGRVEIAPDKPDQVGEFRWLNDGTLTLDLKRIVPSCGCTAPRANTQRIAPGEELVVTVDFHVGKEGANDSVLTLLFEQLDKPLACELVATGWRHVALELLSANAVADKVFLEVIALSEKEPSGLSIEGVASDDYEASTWRQHTGRREDKIASVWTATVRVKNARPTGRSLDTYLQIHAAGLPPLSVRVGIDG